MTGRRVIATLLVLGGLVLTSCSAAPTPGAARTSAVGATAAPRTPAVVPVAAAPAPVTTASKPPVSTPTAAPDACSHRTAAKLVLVSIRRQHLWLCSHRHVVKDSAITTGAVDLPYDSTPTGRFHIQARDTHQTLTLITGQRYVVQYWIPFDAPLFGFHDAPWQTMPFGSPRYRTQGSHGCVHLPLATIRYLYGWVRVGTPVVIS